MPEALAQILVSNEKDEAVTLLSDGNELIVDTGQEWSARMNLEEMTLESDVRDDGSATLTITYKGLHFEYKTRPGTAGDLDQFIDDYRRTPVETDAQDAPTLATYQDIVGGGSGPERPSSWSSPEIGPRTTRPTPVGATKWEYLSLQRSTNNLSTMMSDLNNRGEGGWELVSFTFLDRTLGLNSIVAVLKRPII